MNDLVYCGRAVPHCTAELVAPAPPVAEPLALPVPGRAGMHLLGARTAPLPIRVRLHLDAGVALDAAARASVRHEISSVLRSAEAGELAPPSETGYTYAPCMLTASSGWDDLFEAGSMDVTFTCLDPIAYGREAGSTEGTFDVGGTAPTWPVIELVASGAARVAVADVSGLDVEISGGAAAGARVLIDVLAEAVTVDGADAAARISLESRFAALAPGRHAMTFTGCTSHTVRWRERWL